MTKRPVQYNKRQLDRLFRGLPIVAVYLFGSRAKGRAGAMSDYDVAIQVSEKTPPAHYLDIQLKAMGRLVDTLQYDQVDVVILNDAPLLLRYEVLHHGELIYDRRPAERARLAFRSMMQCLDWQYYEKRFARAFIQRVATKGL